LTVGAISRKRPRQTAAAIPDSYGLGWGCGGEGCGHGGAHATNMWIDRATGLITVWLIQACGGFPNGGEQAGEAFNQAVRTGLAT